MESAVFKPKWIKDGSLWIAFCECGRSIKSKAYYLQKHSGKCRSCCVKKLPFEHLFNKLKNTAKNEKHSMSLSFRDFLEFTKQSNCHYCRAFIEWKPYNYENSEYVSGSYFLDRKDNDKGYSVDNCVVCCSRCNRAKGNRYSYEEWFGMTSYFRNK